MNGEIEDVVNPTEDKDVLRLNDQPSQNQMMFEFQATTFHYERAPHIYHFEQQD